MVKQIKIDNGQIGGAIAVFSNAMFIVQFGTFITVCGIAYDSFLHKFVSLQMGFLILAIGAIMWFCFYYFIIYPSAMSFQNEQAYKHDSPIKSDFEDIKLELEDIKKEINEIKQSLT